MQSWILVEQMKTESCLHNWVYEMTREKHFNLSWVHTKKPQSKAGSNCPESKSQTGHSTGLTTHTTPRFIGKLYFFPTLPAPSTSNSNPDTRQPELLPHLRYAGRIGYRTIVFTLPTADIQVYGCSGSFYKMVQEFASCRGFSHHLSCQNPI